jgi:hypothetical protein
MRAAIDAAVAAVGLACFVVAFILLRKAFQQPVQPFDGGYQ